MTAPEHPPNVSVTQITTSSIQLEWLPPPDVPGIIRYYNISYRVLNISNSEEVEVSVSSDSTSYLIQELTGLMLCEINVSAITVKPGPSEMIKVLTNEGGRSILRFYKLSTGLMQVDCQSFIHQLNPSCFNNVREVSSCIESYSQT